MEKSTDSSKENVRFKCDMCNKTFYQKSNLKRHSLTHTGERPFECEICQKTFTRSAHLKRHFLTHVKADPELAAKFDASRKRSRKARRKLGVEEAIEEPDMLEADKSAHDGYAPHFLDSEAGDESEAVYGGAEDNETGHMEDEDPPSPLIAPAVIIKEENDVELNDDPCLQAESQKDFKPFRCEVCHRRFMFISHLENHMVTHTGEKRFACDLCPKRFAQKFSYKRHMKTHTGEKCFQCKLCLKMFAQRDNLKRHLESHAGERRYQCDICQRAFTQFAHLKAHVLTHARNPSTIPPNRLRETGIEALQAMEESNSSSAEGALGLHFLDNEGDTGLDSASQEDGLDAVTEREVADEGRDKAVEQSASGDALESLSVTIKEEDDDDLEYNEVIYTETKVIKPKDKRKFKCEVCQKKFLYWGHLESHLLTHTGEKPFACDICPKRFAQKFSYKRHMQTHNGGKSFTCEVCHKTFNQSYNLKRHMDSHNGIRPFQCEVCQRSFLLLAHLKAHLLTHLKAGKAGKAGESIPGFHFLDAGDRNFSLAMLGQNGNSDDSEAAANEQEAGQPQDDDESREAEGSQEEEEEVRSPQASGNGVLDEEDDVIRYNDGSSLESEL